jgi:hypothetical protein
MFGAGASGGTDAREHRIGALAGDPRYEALLHAVRMPSPARPTRASK